MRRVPKNTNSAFNRGSRRIVRDCTRALFDEHLKGQPQVLLDGDSASVPEVSIIVK